MNCDILIVPVETYIELEAEADDETYAVDEIIGIIHQHLDQVDLAAIRSTGLYHKLKSGNLFLSRKRKCSNVITKGIASGAKRIYKQRLKGCIKVLN